MKKGWLLIALLAALTVFGFVSQDAYAQGAVAGRVIDADGNGVAGAQVVLQGMMHQRGERPFMERAETGENGQFGFRDVPAGRYMITAMARELGGARVQINVRDGEVTEVELQLQGHNGGGGGGEERQFGTLFGVVTDADGNPVAGAIVMVAPVPERGGHGRRHHPRHRGMRVRTDENGAYVFEQVPAGNVIVMARARAGWFRGQTEVVADQRNEFNIQLRGRG